MGKTFNPYTIIILFSDVVKGRTGVKCNTSTYFPSLVALSIAQKEKMVPLGLSISLPSTLTYSGFAPGTSHPQVSWKSSHVWHSARIQKTLPCEHSDSLEFKHWLSDVKWTTQRKPWQCTENSRSDRASAQLCIDHRGSASAERSPIHWKPWCREPPDGLKLSFQILARSLCSLPFPL